MDAPKNLNNLKERIKGDEVVWGDWESERSEFKCRKDGNADR